MPQTNEELSGPAAPSDMHSMLRKLLEMAADEKELRCWTPNDVSGEMLSCVAYLKRRDPDKPVSVDRCCLGCRVYCHIRQAYDDMCRHRHMDEILCKVREANRDG